MTFFTKLAEPMIEKLFQKDIQRLEQRLTKLIEENYRLGGPPHGFLYKGEFLTNLPKNQRPQAEKKLLHVDLRAEADSFFQDRKLMENERKRLTQGLHQILAGCFTEQDVRDSLPNTATLVLPGEIANLTRLRPAAYAFQNKPLHMHNYKLVADILDFYATTQLIY